MIVLGIDVGTTGTKTLALNDNGEILGRGYHEYGLITRPGGIVEQKASDWYDAVVISARQATEGLERDDIAAISLSTQGASMTAVDLAFNELCNVITWMDRRAVEEADYINGVIGSENVYRTTGYSIGSSIDAPKILWLRKNNPELTEKTHSYVSTIEYINYKLTGVNVIDPTNAAIRGMFDINKVGWSDIILAAMELDSKLLPETAVSGTCVGSLTETAASDLGLSRDVKVYLGAHDQYCAALGSGAVNAGDMLLSTGTTWVVLGISDRIIYSSSHISPGIHPVKGLYGELASLKNGGSALKWYKQLVYAESYADLDANAAERLHSSAGLLFAPYFNGAGFPTSDNTRFGSLQGLQLHHDKYDIARALMEGVAFEIRRTLDEFAANGLEVKNLKFMGGAANSRLWTEITGYITGCRMTRMTESEACALGAALIAGVGCGMLPSYDIGLASEDIELSDKSLYDFYDDKFNDYVNFVTRM